MSAFKRWPNFYLVGAAKAGTTSLYQYLRQHPDIYMSPVKEPHFFSRVTPFKLISNPVTDEKRYLALFSDWSGEKVAGEASTSYLLDLHAASRIADVSPQAKILISLRDPVERAYSHYLNNVREGIEHRAFRDAVSHELRSPAESWFLSYVEAGRYYCQVRRYINHFPTAHVKVIFFENLVIDPGLTMRTICRFLEVDDDVASNLFYGIYNAHTAVPRNRWSQRAMASPIIRNVGRVGLPQKMRAKLRDLLLVPSTKPPVPLDARAELETVYHSDSEALAELIRCTPPWIA